MSVEDVLTKICTHNSDVHGCIFSAGDRTFHNLDVPYDQIDRKALTEHVTNMLLLTEVLEESRTPFETVSMEFEGHSVLARQLGDGVLILVCNPIHRSGFRKIQIGLNLFVKPLQDALSAPVMTRPTADQPAEAPASPMRLGEPVKPVRKVPPVLVADADLRYPLSGDRTHGRSSAGPGSADAGTTHDPDDKPRKRRFFRGRE